jgi:DNA-binding NarL/FixJ family response regulator
MERVRTLLADDHALIRAGLRDALNSLSELEIIGEVGNGRELLAALERQPPDLLILDVNMPEFEPLETTQRIRSLHPRLKILIVSAHDDQAYVKGLLGVGVNGYHLKDQPLSDLLLAVRRILGGGRWISDPLVERLIDPQSPASASVLPVLTRRQRELLYLLSQGYNNQRIAMSMELSVKTIENHLTALYRTLGVESRLEANAFAAAHPNLLLSPHADRAQPPAADPAVETFAVLVVDDNARYRAQLARLLGKTHPGMVVHEAEDSTEAVQLAGQVQPRLALIDVVLNEEDGIQCTRQVKAVSPATRVILISAYPDREFRRLGMNAGAVALLDKKDLDASAIRQVIADIL